MAPSKFGVRTQTNCFLTAISSRSFLLELRHRLLHRVRLLEEGQHHPEVQRDRLARRANRQEESVEVCHGFFKFAQAGGGRT